MKIKRIEITGFKSFVDRTLLDFDDGITSIVGPNGCGKSNVVDAIRWVMGEQSARNLRGKLMEDVIFGGSENRKPLGMAEVSLIMDNTSGLAPAAFRDYAEIQVTRRLYRNGESDYLLNKTPCRLLDITELFMDTGVGTRAYSIIEQGKIGMIINAKPEDRRSLIEEAAGVTKFKARKKTALRKIEATRQNLVRLNDIISEVRRQMNSLKRQAQRAKRFREFREEMRDLELQFGLREYAVLQEKTEQAEASAEQQTVQVDTMVRRLEQAELDLEQARLRHAEREKEAAHSQESVFQLTGEIQRIENRLEYGSREVESLDRHQERIKAELAAIDRRRTTADEEETALHEARQDHLHEIQTEEAQLKEREAILQSLMEREDTLSRQIETARQDLYALLADLTRMNSRQEEADRRLELLAERNERNRQEAVAVAGQLKRLQQDHATLADNLDAMVSERDKLTGQRSTLQEEQAALRRQLEQVENALLERRETLSRDRSRLESLEQLERSLEGYARGVKTLLSAPQHKAHMRKPVADILDVPPEYETAVEAVLAERVQALLPEQLDHVKQALAYLRDNAARCTFLLPEMASAAPPQIPGGRPLIELIEVRAEFRRPVERLLAGTCLVEDLEDYFGKSLPFGMTLVNADGDILTSRGEVIGGGRQALDQGVLHKKREMKELQKRVKKLADEVDQMNQRRDALRQQTVDTDKALQQAEQDLHQKEISALDSSKDLHGLQQEEARLKERLEVLNLEEQQLHEEEETLRQSIREVTSSRESSEDNQRALEERVDRLQEDMHALRGEADQARQRVTALKVTLASLHERDESRRNALERLVDLRQELQQRQEALQQDAVEAVETQQTLRGEAEELKRTMEDLYRQRVTQEQQLAELRERFDESRQEITQRESELKQQRSQTQQLRDTLSTRQMQNRELQLALEHMLQSFQERYRIDLASPEVTAKLDPEFDPGVAEERRTYLEKRIDEIGDVNLMAIEEYQELEERYLFMTGQQDDLQTSLDGLQAAIAKINRTTRKRFRETFDQVNATFRDVFPRLFNGGQAELRLTDEADLLETGIDVVAQPPGKKLQNVTLLSGGEKALTAVAMIFSIFLIKPSPFCLLDEVDAPLDDANIGRFNDIVKDMAETSQFIIITHNKRTMEIADNLYGITMEEPGVSKLVSVCMKEVA
ncbi:MAG: chromosome segregation protein SMC [Desulfuromonadales bacterium]|jgi:chromosome segregation protein